MAGRHARTRRFSPTAIAATAAVGVALAIGGTVGAVRLTSGDASDRSVAVAPTAVDPPAAASAPLSVPPNASPSASGSPSVSGSPSPPSPRSPIASPASVRKTQAPSRSKPRTATPQPTATSTSASVVETGSCGASYYSEGQLTASGEPFDPSAMTAAHKTLPFDTRVRVTNPATSTSVTVRINDRGPFIDGRCIDLSRAAFAEIAPLSAGHVEVRYEVLG